jgi:CPA2 family monovalent cation:H+ antiporter-2
MINTLGDSSPMRLIAGVVTLLICSPFLFAIVLKAPRKISSEEAPTLLRLSRLQPGMVVLRLLVGVVLVAAVVNQFSTTRTAPLALLVVTPIFIFTFRRFIERLYSAVENRFLRNLNAKERAEVESLSQMPQLAPRDAALVQVVLSSDSPVAGKTLEECKFRSVTGATVAMIDRGRRRIFAPGRGERLLPNDELFLIGTDEQIAAVQELISYDAPDGGLSHDELFNLESFVVSENSPFANHSIREAGLGDQFNALIVGVESRGNRILNPESTVILLPGDLIWVFGKKSKVRELKLEGKKFAPSI